MDAPLKAIEPEKVTAESEQKASEGIRPAPQTKRQPLRRRRRR